MRQGAQASGVALGFEVRVRCLLVGEAGSMGVGDPCKDAHIRQGTSGEGGGLSRK